MISRPQHRPARRRSRIRRRREFLLGAHLQLQTSAHRLALLPLQPSPTTTAHPTDYPDRHHGQHRSSTYAGGQVSFSANLREEQSSGRLLQLLPAGSANSWRDLQRWRPTRGNSPFADTEHLSGNLDAFFIDDKFKPLPWLTLSAGMRPTHFSGGVAENRHQPPLRRRRTVPRLNWTFRAFYGHYYQAPPLITASGPLLATGQCQQSAASLPCTANATKNINSASPFPTADGFSTPTTSAPTSQISSTTTTLASPTSSSRSPSNAHHSRLGTHSALAPHCPPRPTSSRLFQSDRRGPEAPSPAASPISPSSRLGPARSRPAQHPEPRRRRHSPLARLCLHQRLLRLRIYQCLPRPALSRRLLAAAHHLDLTVGKDFGERFSASLNALNVANRRVELDNSVTFGGFHWNNPREIYLELRYRFHY